MKYDDVTIGLIQSLSAIARALRTRPLKSSAVRVALQDLALCEDLKAVLKGGGLPPVPSPCSPLEPPLTPTPVPPSTKADDNARVRARPLAQSPPLFKIAESMPPDVAEIVGEWNTRFSLPRVQTIGKRAAIVKKALQDEFWSENWLLGIKKLVKTPFCMGKNRRKWKADFEWFCDPVNLDKLLTGKYDNLSSTSEPPDYAREEI